MKKFMLGLILFLTIVLIVLGLYCKRLNEKYEVSMNNNKAYENEKVEFKETIRQLKASKDSIDIEFLKVCDSLKIKQKKVIEYKYIKSTAERVDTIMFKDTIFLDGLCLDTTIGDQYYNAKIHLEYPDILVVDPVFESSMYLITHKKRETINPPRKFFLFRLFQKKQTIIETEVVEKNPYIKTNNTKFVEVVK